LYEELLLFVSVVILSAVSTISKAKSEDGRNEKTIQEYENKNGFA